MERVKTGIDRLDNLIKGEFPKDTVTLVSGPPGGGKTILCYQIFIQGIGLRG